VSKTRIGIDLGGTKIEAIVMNSDGEITHRQRVGTPKDDYQDAISAIHNLVIDIETDAGIKEALPVGIGTPGAISSKTGLMKNCNSTCLNGMPLLEDLAALMMRPVRIANDADCFVLSEARDGAAKGASNVFGVILGTGAGGGICINQDLVTGINSIAGEWGHNPLPLNNLITEDAPVLNHRTCYCGHRDCVETWVAGPAFEKSFENISGQPLSAPDIVVLAEQNDSQAMLVLEHYYNLLALALSTVINILDPEVIVLGGGMSNIESLYHRVPDYLEQYVFTDRVDTKLVKALHGDSGGVRGAAWLW
jgi:predicted NBD/HSP70 family sugar kinase